MPRVKKAIKPLEKTTEITGEQKPIRSLYELVGLSVNPYQHDNLEDYKAHLDTLTFSDLQEHSINVGVIPRDNRQRLEDDLHKEFVKKMGDLSLNDALTAEAKASEENKSTLTKEQQIQLKNFLSRGR